MAGFSDTSSMVPQKFPALYRSRYPSGRPANDRQFVEEFLEVEEAPAEATQTAA